MASRVLFLGTAGDVIVTGKQSRASGGIAMELEGLRILLNPGPGAVVRACQYQINLREVDVVIATQNTILAANDVNAVVDGMTNGGLDTKGVLLCSSEVIDGIGKLNPAISSQHKEQIEKIITLKPEQKVALNSIEFIPTEVKGTGVGLKIKTTDATIGYTSVTGYSRQIAEQYDGCDLLIICVPHLTKKSEDGLNVEDAIKFIQIAKPRMVVVTGFGVKLLEGDLLGSIREMQRQTQIETVAAKEGLIFDPNSYSQSQRQKRLVV
jgi:hypothetical protein